MTRREEEIVYHQELPFIRLGETFRPFPQMNPEISEGLVNGRVSSEFKLSRYGSGIVYLSSTVEGESAKTHLVVVDGNIKSLPYQDSFSFDTTVSFPDNRIPKDVGIVCLVDIGDLHLIAYNAEKENPDIAGYMTYFEWQDVETGEPVELVLSAAVMPFITMRFVPEAVLIK